MPYPHCEHETGRCKIRRSVSLRNDSKRVNNTRNSSWKSRGRRGAETHPLGPLMYTLHCPPMMLRL